MRAAGKVMATVTSLPAAFLLGEGRLQRGRSRGRRRGPCTPARPRCAWQSSLRSSERCTSAAAGCSASPCRTNRGAPSGAGCGRRRCRWPALPSAMLSRVARPGRLLLRPRTSGTPCLAKRPFSLAMISGRGIGEGDVAELGAGHFGPGGLSESTGGKKGLGREKRGGRRGRCFEKAAAGERGGGHCSSVSWLHPLRQPPCVPLPRSQNAKSCQQGPAVDTGRTGVAHVLLAALPVRERPPLDAEVSSDRSLRCNHCRNRAKPVTATNTIQHQLDSGSTSARLFYRSELFWWHLAVTLIILCAISSCAHSFIRRRIWVINASCRTV